MAQELDQDKKSGEHAHGRPHAHGHAHGHGHRHGHGAPRVGVAFGVSIGLNLAFVVVGVVAGVMARSMALVADAAHNFGDVLGLVLAWAATRLAQRKPSRRRTYGLRRTTILAAVANAVLLLVAVGGVSTEALRRFSAQGEVSGRIVMAVAALGVVINAGAAIPFFAGRHRDVNLRAAFLHLMADAGVSLAVVVAGALIVVTGATWIDPLASLLVSAVILIGVVGVLRESLDLALDAVPEGIDPEAVRDFLARLDGVVEVHDLHIWAMSTTETALTAHLVMHDESTRPAFLRDVCHALEHQFAIHHATLQVESPGAVSTCAQASDDVV